MREIKFRAWWVPAKFMVEVEAIVFDDHVLTLIECEDGHFEEQQIDVVDCVIQQFTGLTDKNGKEIYEGDVVTFELTRTVPVDHPVMFAMHDETAIYQGAIKWGEFGWRPFTDGATAKKMEVIGNIYENPELLTV